MNIYLNKEEREKKDKINQLKEESIEELIERRRKLLEAIGRL